MARSLQTELRRLRDVVALRTVHSAPLKWSGSESKRPGSILMKMICTAVPTLSAAGVVSAGNLSSARSNIFSGEESSPKLIKAQQLRTGSRRSCQTKDRIWFHQGPNWMQECPSLDIPWSWLISFATTPTHRQPLPRRLVHTPGRQQECQYFAWRNRFR